MKQISLAALRVNAGMTQRQAAEEIGVGLTTIVSWEAYKTFPSLAYLEKICRAYDCTMDDIRLPKTATLSC